MDANFNFTNKIILTWEDPDDKRNSSDYKHYIWMSTGPSGTLRDVTNTTEEVSNNAPVAGKSISFLNLTAGQWYCVSVITVLRPANVTTLESYKNKYCHYTRELTIIVSFLVIVILEFYFSDLQK